MMDDSQYTSFQVSGKVPKPPTAGELAMDLWWHCAHGKRLELYREILIWKLWSQ
jgi:hypothetical protein